MKRIFYFLLFILILTGCDQKVPLTATSAKIFNVSGYVYEYDYLKNVTSRDKPIENVTISISGESLAITQTTSNGAFSLNLIPTGKYIITATKEGYQRNGKAAYSLIYDFSSSSIEGTTQAVELDLDPRPAFLGSSVQDYAEVLASTRSFKIYFSEPMSTESVTAFIKYLSLRSSDLSVKALPSTSISWESDEKIMILTLDSDLAADALYQIGVACSNSGFGLNGIVDEQNQSIYGTRYYDYLLYNSSSDSRYGYYLYVPFKTATDKTGKPAKPTALSIKSTIIGSTEINYDSVYSSSSGIDLIFNGTNEANGYRVYASKDNINYNFVKESSTTSVFIAVSDIVSALGSSIACGYDTYGYPIDPGLPWPFLGGGVYFKVAGYNSFGEGTASDPLVATDTIKPTASAAAISESGTIKVVKFSEPLNKSSAENKNNYVLVGVPTREVVSATLVNDYNYTLTPYKTTFVRLVISSSEAGPRKINISNIKDLTGNQIAPSAEATY